MPKAIAFPAADTHVAMSKPLLDGRYALYVAIPAPGTVPDRDATRLLAEMVDALDEATRTFRDELAARRARRGTD